MSVRARVRVRGRMRARARVRMQDGDNSITLISLYQTEKKKIQIGTDDLQMV